MTLSPLAFFDLLEQRAAEWLPAAADDAAWGFERFMNLAERRGELRLILHTSDGRATLAAIVRAKSDEIAVLQGSVRFGSAGREVSWALPFRPLEDLAERILALAAGWQPQVREAVNGLLPALTSTPAPLPQEMPPGPPSPPSPAETGES
jgi:hypothetical protein